jgi:hypothetical protein
MRTIRDFVDRHLTTRAVIAVTILLLLASWIYPPWIIGSGRYVSHGWFFVFDTTRGVVMRVDFGRLFLIDGIILAAGGLLAWTFFQNSTGRRVAVRIVFYTLIVAPIAGLILFLGAVLIKTVQYDMAKRAAGQTRRFDPSTATLLPSYDELTSSASEPKKSKASPYDALLDYFAHKQPVTVEIPGHGIVEFPAGMSSAEIAAVIKKKFFSGEPWKKFDPNQPFEVVTEKGVVAPDDLKKIVLFDVGPVGPFRGRDTWNGVYGRVRNDLPRSVEKIGLKASFYNAQEELIEVRTFWMNVPSALPNTPVSFESNERVDHLPYQWRYQLEVIEAHYVK